tara:strand:+ start:2346 stop:3092 length:747 start_codon:yes stop_codon:yes gene_type:complete
MTPLELAIILITAATSLKDAGMELEIDPSANPMDLATLVSIAYAENEQGENIGSGQSILRDKEGKREVSFGPFQINKFWYRDKSKSGDTTVVNNEYTDVFDGATPKTMPELLKDPLNSALAAIIVANSKKGFENWTTYTSDAYGIKEQDYESKYWKAGFNAAVEELYKVNITVPELDLLDESPEITEIPFLEKDRREFESQVPKEADSYALAKYRSLKTQEIDKNFRNLMEKISNSQAILSAKEDNNG